MKFLDKLFGYEKLNKKMSNNISRNFSIGAANYFSQEFDFFNPYYDVEKGLLAGYENDYFLNLGNHLINNQKTFYNNLNSEIFFVVDYIAQTVANLPIDIYKNKYLNQKITGTKKHFMLNEKANDLQLSYEFKYELIYNIYCYGYAYVYYYQNPNESEFDKIYVLNNLQLFDKGDYYEYKEKDKITKFSKEEINIFKYNSYCESPVAKILKDFGLLLKLKKGLNAQIELIGHQGIIITNSKTGELDFDVENNLRLALKKAIEGNDSFVQTVGIDTEERIVMFEKDKSSKDLNPIIKEQRRIIATHLGLPAGLIGGDSNQGKSELISEFYTSTLTKRCGYIEKFLTNILYPVTSIKLGWCVKFNFSELLRGDETTKTNIEIAKFNAGISTLEEARFELGLEQNLNLTKEVNDGTNKI